MDIIGAFVLAASTHIGLGLWLAQPGAAPGVGQEPAQSVTVTPATAAALAARWRTPPNAADVTEPLRPTPALSSAAPVIARQADSRPIPKPPTPLKRPTAETTLPAVPAAMPTAIPETRPVRAPRLISPATEQDPIEAFRDHDPRAPAAEAIAAIAPDRQIEAPEPLPSRIVAMRPEETTVRPRPRPSASSTHAAAPAASAQTRKATASRPPKGAGGRLPGAAETRRLQAAWAGAIKALIAQAQRHPGAMHGAGRVRLVFVVSRTGKLSDVQITASSGSPGLDRAALNAVRNAAPFPKAPNALPDEWMKFGQWVEFRSP